MENVTLNDQDVAYLVGRSGKAARTKIPPRLLPHRAPSLVPQAPLA